MVLHIFNAGFVFLISTAMAHAWDHVDQHSPRRNCLPVFSSENRDFYTTLAIKDNPTVEYSKRLALIDKLPAVRGYEEFAKLFQEIINNPQLKWLFSNDNDRNFFSDQVLKDFTVFNALKSSQIDEGSFDLSISREEILYLAYQAELALFRKHIEYKETRTLLRIEYIIENILVANKLLKRSRSRYMPNNIYARYIRSAYEYLILVRKYNSEKGATQGSAINFTEKIRALITSYEWEVWGSLSHAMVLTPSKKDNFLNELGQLEKVKKALGIK